MDDFERDIMEDTLGEYLDRKHVEEFLKVLELEADRAIGDYGYYGLYNLIDEYKKHFGL